MLSDDVFRSRLQVTVASLRYWVPAIADTACVKEIEAEEFWKIDVVPRVAGACPFELVLRADQHFDAQIASQIYEDREIVSLGLFLPLVEALAVGQVIERRWLSTATASPLAIETIIMLADGSEWRDGHTLSPAGVGLNKTDAERHDTQFLPYRR